MTNSDSSRPLAYLDADFLRSDDARPVRIMAEYLGPLSVFDRHHVQDTVIFMGSARVTESSDQGRYYNEARELARELTTWAKTVPHRGQRFLVCTGGGPGIMEAANRGAHDAGGRSIGLNIGLPHEQRPNPYITREFNFEFHYFFMRKLWFAHLAASAVIFPGGFGTLDELCEFLTLAQTQKLERKMQILLYGREFWKSVLDFDALIRHGTISREDLALFQPVDSPEEALTLLKERLLALPETPSEPAFAHSASFPPCR